MEKIKIICLHGFLGRPTDWDFIQSHFMVSPLARQFEWWSIDYMSTDLLNSKNSFLDWAQNFNKLVAMKYPTGPRVLVGYSLGGRLALHALAESPKLYDAFVMISTNPGLSREKEIQERLESDQQWARKFASDSWSLTLNEWNAQNVFKDSVAEPQRLEHLFDRNLLAQALTEWSLARQADFRDLIALQQDKILCLTGERDIKFLSLAMDLKKRAPGITEKTIPRASHRVLFDNPGEVSQQMIQFLQKKFS